MAFTMNMKGVGGLIDNGEYECTLVKGTVRDAKNPDKEGNINKQLMVQCTIDDSDNTTFNGRNIFQFLNLTEQGAPFLYNFLTAFDADPEDLDVEDFDPEAYVNQTLKGNKAIVTVTTETYNGRESNRYKFSMLQFQ